MDESCGSDHSVASISGAIDDGATLPTTDTSGMFFLAVTRDL